MTGHDWRKTGRHGDTSYWKCRACGLRTLTFPGSEDKDAERDSLGREHLFWTDGYQAIVFSLVLSRMACAEITAWRVHET